MTFTQKAKGAMLGVEIKRACCKKAFLYALLLFSRAFEHNMLLLTGDALVKTALSFFPPICGVDLSQYARKSGARRRLLCADPEALRRVFSCFEPPSSLPPRAINREHIACEECRGAFVRGAFLVCGGITAPEKRYHLEFTLSQKSLAEDLRLFLRECSLNVGMTKRSEHFALYSKDSEEIVDLLAFTGAHSAAFHLMNAKIEKDIRNACNRVNNCETANLQKTIVSSLRQIAAIQTLRRAGRLDRLPVKLRATALLRLENPDMTIGELALAHDPPVTKSCVVHRLRKLSALAGE